MVVHDEKGNLSLTTNSRRTVNPTAVRPEDFDIEDIAYSLSMQCRFLGHCDLWYSNAEHSCLVADLAYIADEEPVVELCALLHDAAEIFLGDLHPAVKHAIPDLVALEARMNEALCTRFDLPPPGTQVWEVVKKYDDLAVGLEAARVFTPALPWASEPEMIHAVHPQGTAREIFMRRYNDIRRRLCES